MNQNFEAYIAPARNEKRWWKVLLTLVVWFVVYLLGSFAMGELAFRNLDIPGFKLGSFTTPIGMFVLLMTFVVWILAFWGALRLFHKRGLGTVIGGPKSKLFRDFGITFAICAGLMLFLNWVAPSSDEINENIVSSRWWSLLPFALVLMFIQVSAEEILFRGYIQQQLAVWFKSRWVFLVLPSVLFGLAHFFNTELGLQAQLTVVGFTALLGLFMADLTYRTGNLGAAIAVHFVNNFSSLLWVSYQKEMSGLARYYSPEFEGNPEGLVLAGTGMMVTMSVVFVIYFVIMEWRERR